MEARAGGFGAVEGKMDDMIDLLGTIATNTGEGDEFYDG